MQLSWDPVDGAGQYIIYMVDISANYLIHRKAEGVTETHLDIDAEGNTGNIIAYGHISAQYSVS